MKHGGSNAYDQGCRCDVCVDAWNDRHRELRARRTQRRPDDNANLDHGTRSTYVNHGCRCNACVDAHSEAEPAPADPGEGRSVTAPAYRLGP